MDKFTFTSNVCIQSCRIYLVGLIVGTTSECPIRTYVEGNCYNIILGAVLQFPEEMEANHENLNPESSNLVFHKNRISRLDKKLLSLNVPLVSLLVGQVNQQQISKANPVFN
jgi:hypothetical protein